MTKVGKNLESGKYDPIEAAGGAVRNRKGELLMIFRYGRWDLPKGHREAGEGWEQCALREVSEETGLPMEELEIGAQVAVTHHTYTLDGREKLKETRWFAMHYRGNALLRPQTEEGIEAAAWIAHSQLPEVLAGTYETIRQVVGSLGAIHVSP